MVEKENIVKYEFNKTIMKVIRGYMMLYAILTQDRILEVKLARDRIQEINPVQYWK